MPQSTAAVPDVVPALVAAVEGTNLDGPLAALAEVTPDVALPYIRRALAGEGDVERRREAADAVRDMAMVEGTRASCARTLIPELGAALRADDQETVQLVLEALQMLGKDAEPTVESVRRLLESEDPWIRRWAELVMEAIAVP